MKKSVSTVMFESVMTVLYIIWMRSHFSEVIDGKTALLICVCFVISFIIAEAVSAAFLSLKWFNCRGLIRSICLLSILWCVFFIAGFVTGELINEMPSKGLLAFFAFAAACDHIGIRCLINVALGFKKSDLRTLFKPEEYCVDVDDYFDV